MMKNLLPILVIFFNGFLYSQDYSALSVKYNKYIQSNEHFKALPLLEKAVEQGDSEAQFILGNWYKNGTVVEHDQQKSAELFLKSAAQNNNKALLAIAECHLYGEGVKKDFKKAFSFIFKCAKNGDFDCIAGVSTCYINEIGVVSNPDEILKWSLLLSRKSFTDEMLYNAVIIFKRLKIARLYKTGTKLKQDYFNSYVWYLKYNELKNCISEFEQKKAIEEIKEVATKLTDQQKKEAKEAAEKLLDRPILNVENLQAVQTINN